MKIERTPIFSVREAMKISGLSGWKYFENTRPNTEKTWKCENIESLEFKDFKVLIDLKTPKTLRILPKTDFFFCNSQVQQFGSLCDNGAGDMDECQQTIHEKRYAGDHLPNCFESSLLEGLEWSLLEGLYRRDSFRWSLIRQFLLETLMESPYSNLLERSLKVLKI